MTTERKLFWTVVICGLALHIYAACVTWIGGDEAHLLRLGSALASEGRIIPFGKLLHGAGTNPGILLQLLFGIPMYFVPDYRAPMIFVILSHILAFWLLIKVLRSVFSESVLLPFAIIYWLTPWRIFNASLLWEPAFIFLPAALHLWSCYQLREQKKFWPSVACLVSIVAAIQIHGSFLILIVATILLLWKKRLYLDLRGALLGTVLGSLTLIPSIVAVINNNLVYGEQQPQGYIGKGFVTVAPLLKGVLYWCTLGGSDAVRNLKETSFAESSGKYGIYSLQLLCILTVIISILASWWYFRPLWTWKKKRPSDHQNSKESQWVRVYCLSVLTALVFSAGLSPMVLQGWQVVIALHAAAIPVAVWAAEKWKTKVSPGKYYLQTGIYSLLQITIMVVLFAGQSIFNRSSELPDHHIDPVKDSTLLRYIPPFTD